MNDQTYNSILASNRDRLFSTAVYVLRDADDAEDIVQEAFLRLWRFTGRIDPVKIPAWLTRVVHNLCIDQTRRQKTLRRHLGRPDELALDTLASTDNPDAEHEHGEGPTPEQQALLEAMTTLPTETRSIMIMHYYQGLKLAEIAEILDMNINSLKVRIHRARRSLRLVLTKRSDELSARQETG
jgi:RNA polymerase sigma-70 factor, ECF subfamily